MLDIESLKIDAGYKTRSSESYSGIGAQGGSKAWEETYKKIMKSNESISFYLVAAQEHLDYITVRNFAIETGVENLRKEKNILKIIEPLSKENSDIYMRIVNEFGLEGIGDKVKSAAGKVWAAIKEAFRKLRLAIANIIQSIRKAVASVFNGGDTTKYRERMAEIRNLVRGDVGKKTVKVEAQSAKRWLMLQNVNKFYDHIVRMVGESGSKLTREFEQFAQKFQKAGKVAGKYALHTANDPERLMKTRVGYGKYGNMAKDLLEKFAKAAGVNISGLSTKGNPVNFVLYGNAKPTTANVPIRVIIETPGADWLIAPNAVQTLKLLSSNLDVVINGINKILSNVEKFEKTMDTNGGSNDAKAKTENIAFLKNARDMLNRLTLLSKEIFIQSIKLRKTYIRACKVALGGKDDKAPEPKKNDKK